MKNRDLVFIDTETTGLNLQNELLQIAVIRVKSDDFSILDEWSVKIKPRHIENADPEALKVNGYNEEEWRNAVDIEQALDMFNEKTKDAVPVGHNLPFDLFFLKKELNKYDRDATFFYHGLDTVSLAWQELKNVQEVERFSLNELARYFKIGQPNAHDALADAKTTYQLFLKLDEQ